MVSKAGRKILVKRIVVFMLLVGLSGAWSKPVNAQSPGVAEYARNSREFDKKSAKAENKKLKKASRKQQKSMKKYSKSQRKAAKKANRHPK